MPANEASLPLPEPVRAVADALERAGHEAVFVGGCVRDLLQGRPVADYDIATGAAPEDVIALFPRAVPIGLRHGTVMVPTAAGPVDVTRFRAPDLAGDLGRRDFTVNAIAWRTAPEPGFLDPEGGREDLAAGRLRAVRSAPDRLAEDPVRVLRALRLGAELGLALDPALRDALGGAAPGLAQVAGERLGRELVRLLMGPHVREMLEVAVATGVDAELVPGRPTGRARAVPALVAALPAQLELRLAGYLAGASAPPVLARLRVSRRARESCETLLRWHPIDRPRRGGLARMLRAVEPDGLEALLVLRRAELAALGEPAESLAEVEAAVARLRERGSLDPERTRLAVSGRDVMRWLDCEPGPAIGEALAYLEECVLEDPSCNDPERLRERLRSRSAPGDPT